MEKEQLVEIANTVMPFGKYKGRRLIDVPEEYLLWFARKDEFPPGKLGEATGAAPETPALSLCGVAFLLRLQCVCLLLVATCQHGTHHQLNLMEDHQRQHHHSYH